jgi:GNAT superfamily N-acetyltransferase
MFGPAEYTLRALTPDDEPILWEMLYLALPRSGEENPPREMVQLPQYARYVANWGHEGDRGFLAHDKSGSTVLGAVWLRPSLGTGQGDSPAEIPFVVRQGHRQHGIGASLLTQMIRANPSLSAVLLHVGRDSAAVRLFERFGFDLVSESESGVVMRRQV